MLELQNNNCTNSTRYQSAVVNSHVLVQYHSRLHQLSLSGASHPTSTPFFIVQSDLAEGRMARATGPIVDRPTAHCTPNLIIVLLTKYEPFTKLRCHCGIVAICRTSCTFLLSFWPWSMDVDVSATWRRCRPRIELLEQKTSRESWAEWRLQLLQAKSLVAHCVQRLIW